MNAQAICHFYDYHFAQNRYLWEKYVMGLTDEQFIQEFNYSLGSVRNHLVHLISVDDTWFKGLRGVEIPEPLNPAEFNDRLAMRKQWDEVEEMMRGYLATLQDEDLLSRPFPEGEDEQLVLWQVLLHVVNHGTDHRAQLLRLLHDLGLKTTAQDYIFYVYEHP